jgi:hypothetical protein
MLIIQRGALLIALLLLSHVPSKSLLASVAKFEYSVGEHDVWRRGPTENDSACQGFSLPARKGIFLSEFVARRDVAVKVVISTKAQVRVAMHPGDLLNFGDELILRFKRPPHVVTIRVDSTSRRRLKVR